MSRVRTCLWFETDAEAAVRLYVSLLPDSRVDHVQRAPAAWPAGAAGDVILIDFTLDGQRYQVSSAGRPPITAPPPRSR